jgi:hypothetical protein
MSTRPTIPAMRRRGNPHFVMAGLDPAIHVFLSRGSKDVDARLKAGHDEFHEVVRVAVSVPLELDQRAHRHVHGAQLGRTAKIRQVDDEAGGDHIGADLA